MQSGSFKDENKLSDDTQMRQVKYLNNIVEQDHRFIKKRVRAMLGFKSFCTARRTLYGIEAMHMIKKEQVTNQSNQAFFGVHFINQWFGVAS
jgi:transposase-like protein